MGNMPVIKDLIVDMDAVHWKKIQRVTPWLINKEPIPEREYIVPRESMVDVTQSMACIQCGACVSDCLSMEVDPLFIGPAALAKAYRFVGDPRDAQQYERLKDLAEDPHGIYDCTHCFKCIEACPKGVAPMSQIMRLRRRAGDDHDINDRNNGERHETAFVSARPRQRPAVGGRAAAALLRRRLVLRQVRAARRRSSSSTRCRSITKALLRRKVTPTGALKPHKLPKDDLKQVQRIYETVEGRDERVELNLYISGYDEDTSRPRADDARERRVRMKVAYWPGCVSRGFTPELHGSMAKVAPLLDIELVELDRALLHRRRRDRRAQPGARRHAQRAHVRARPAGRRRRADDEHLLDLPGRAERVPGAPRRERRVPRARQRDAAAERASPTRRASSNKNFLWLLVEEIGLDELRARVKRPLTDLQGRAVLRLLHRAPGRPPRASTTSTRATPTSAQVIEALGGTVIEYAGSHKCCGFPIITMNKEASLKQAGRHLGDAVDADADCLVTPCPLCHLNLDLQQPLAERVVGRELNMPVLHLPQLVGLALGLEPKELGLAAPRRQADVGDRLDDVGRRRRGGGRVAVCVAAAAPLGWRGGGGLTGPGSLVARRWRCVRRTRGAGLRRDVVAGIVLAALLVPQGMAYAELAGVPPVTGLYATLVPLVVYFLLGPSPILVLGPDSAVAPLVAAAIIPLAAGGDASERIALAGLLAIIVGGDHVRRRAGALRLRRPSCCRCPCALGYLMGIAVTVIVAQLPKLFGFSVDAGELRARRCATSSPASTRPTRPRSRSAPGRSR